MASDNDGDDPWKAVLDLVAGALDELGSDPPKDAKGRPRIVVLDGGKKRGEREPADPERDGLSADPGSQVRVLREAAGGRRAPLGEEGRIRVRPGDPTGWQTVFRGAEARAYRVLCAAGALELQIDGLPGERLAAGQSLDVEAKLIRVRTADDGVGIGTYVRLAPGPLG